MYDKLQLKNDIKYFCKKMRISESEFERYEITTQDPMQILIIGMLIIK